MHQWRQHQGAVRYPASDYDVCALVQCGHQPRRAKIGVQADHHAGEGLAGGHLGDAGFCQFFLFHQQVIAEHQRNLQVDAGLFAQALQRIAASHGVYPTGVSQNPDAFFLYFTKQRRHHGFHEIPGIALRRVFHLLARHDRHGDLRQVVGNQVIDVALAHQLGGGGFGIAPESGGTADADGLVGV